MTSNTLPVQTSYTYEDYKKFPDELRCEILDGQIYDMTPSPSTNHQQVTGQIYHLVRSHLSAVGHSCRAFIAPTDVVLAEDQVVQPDVLVVRDRSKMKPASSALQTRSSKSSPQEPRSRTAVESSKFTNGSESGNITWCA